MEVSDQLHDPATLAKEKQFLIVTEEELSRPHNRCGCGGDPTGNRTHVVQHINIDSVNPDIICLCGTRRLMNMVTKSHYLTPS
jgi:hypothetical protein